MLTNLFAAMLLVALPPPQAGSGAQGPVSPAPPGEQTPLSDSYLIGAHDELLITVYDEATLTGKYRVDETGFVAFPYIQRVVAAGLTVPAFQNRLRDALTEFIRNPQVRVSVETYRSQSVMVSGAVRAPQKVPITGTSTTLLEVLAIAGSPTAEASNEIVVTRKTPTTADPAAIQEFRINRRELETGRALFTLRDGDFISVPVADKFYVDGFVRSPGTYVLDPGMTVRQAIVLAGGLHERGSDRNITVRRTMKGREVDVDVRLDDKVLPNDFIRIRQRLF